jgi:hypothetical protein
MWGIDDLQKQMLAKMLVAERRAQAERMRLLKDIGRAPDSVEEEGRRMAQRVAARYRELVARGIPRERAAALAWAALRP